MNDGEQLIDEVYSKPVMDAEAEVAMVIPEVSDEELAEPVEDAPEMLNSFDGFNEVSEAASHAETIIDATPVITEEPAPLVESRVEGLADDRYQALEDDREEATEAALREYADQREEELGLVEAAAHEQWAESDLEDKIDALKEEYA